MLSAAQEHFTVRNLTRFATPNLPIGKSTTTAYFTPATDPTNQPEPY
jgi:hypothetical protein